MDKFDKKEGGWCSREGKGGPLDGGEITVML